MTTCTQKMFHLLQYVAVVALVSVMMIGFSVVTSEAVVPNGKHKLHHVMSRYETMDLSRDYIVLRTAELSKGYEGFSSRPYVCAVSGHLTIGYGSLVRQHKNPPSFMSEKQATKVLVKELYKCADDLDRYLPWWKNLSIDRRIALVSLTHNLGMGGVLKFKNMLKHLKSGDYEQASMELLYKKGHKNSGKTRYSRQVGYRAVEIAHAFSEGEWKDMRARG